MPWLIAALTRMVRDVGIAEDLAQDALVAALEQWLHSGVPELQIWQCTGGSKQLWQIQ